MRCVVPSVASDPNVILPARAHSSQNSPMTRSPSEAASREPAPPFAALLDSAGQADNPPPRPERTGRLDRANRPDAAASSNQEADEVATAKQPADAKDSTPAKPGDEPGSGKPGKVAGQESKGKESEETKDGTAAEPTGDSSSDPQITVDATTNPDALPTSVAAAVTPPIAESQPVTATPDADGLAAAPAACEQSAPDGAVDPAPVQVQNEPAQGDQASANPTVQTNVPDTTAAQAPAAQSAQGQTSQTQTTQTQTTQAITTQSQVAQAQPTQTRPGKPQQAKAETAATPQTKAGHALPQQAKAHTDAPANPAGDDGDTAQPAPQGEVSKDAKPAPSAASAVTVAAHTAGRQPTDVALAAISLRHGDDAAGAAGPAKNATDVLQNLGLWTPAEQTGAAATAASAGANPNAAQGVGVPVAALAVEIATQAFAGKHRFEIRLDPPELGRIDVRLDVDRDGNVTSRLVVDRSDTLDLLKRDAAQLERALQQAGLKMSDNALEFSLRQQTYARDDAPAPTAGLLMVPDDDPAPVEALRQGYGRLLGLGGGLDIRV
jgi:flagellar hook-length control protein FliK